MIKTYDYNNENSRSKFRHFKFISFFIYNRLDHFNQFIKVVMIIPNVSNDTKVDNGLSLLI